MSGFEIENQEFRSEEIIVLQSIYPTEFSILSEKKLCIHVSPCEIESEAHGINETFFYYKLLSVILIFIHSKS